MAYKLAKAVLLLAPVLARGLSIRYPDEPLASAVIIVPVVHSEGVVKSDDLLFRFDVAESQEPCGDPKVAISGKTLPQGGSGDLSTDDGRAVAATWNVSCVTEGEKPQQQFISIGIDSVEGKAVVDVRFSVQFRQTVPVHIAEVEGSATWIRPPSTSQSTAHASSDDASHVVDAELAEIERLKKQVSDLEHKIASKEKYIAESLSRVEANERNVSGTCNSLKCVFNFILNKITSVAKKVHSAAGGGHKNSQHGGCSQQNQTHELGKQTSPHPRPSHGQPSYLAPENGLERPMTMSSSRPSQAPRPGRLSHGPGRQSPHRGFQGNSFFARIPMAVKLSFLAVILLILFIGILINTRQRSDLRRTERRARRWEAHRNHFAARCGEICAAIKAFRAKMTLFSSPDQQHVSPSFVTGRRYRRAADPQSDSESDTTMEQEIASFRTIADVVGDIVAAEEGRGRRGEADVRSERQSLENLRAQRQQQQRWREERRAPRLPPRPIPHSMPPTPPNPTVAFPEYPSEDESLPEYYDGRSSISAEAQVVTDGFRYTPGSSAYSPSSSVESSGADDVLGDSKL